MKLTRLLERHRQSPDASALADNFGDGVLLRTNPIYAKIRAAALSAGARFSSEPNPAYQALPFAQLEKILSSKTIPYVDNVAVIEDLVGRLKEDVAWDDISDGLRKNYVFHESCHVVARSFAGDEKADAFRILMEESFANACEFLAVVDAEDASQRIFFELNSYTALFEEKTNLKNAIKSCGFPVVFEIMWLAYLFSNSLHDRIDEKAWTRCLALADANSLPARQIKALKSLSKVAFTLDTRFRLVTTRFHLKLNGVSTSVDEISKVDLLNQDGLRGFLRSARGVFA